MLKSFFFIPGTHKKFAEKITAFDSDYIVIDLEDSVSPDKVEQAKINLANIVDKSEYCVRLRVFDEHYNVDTELLDFIRKEGFRKILLPKFRSLDDLRKVEAVLESDDKFEFLLLIENPSSLLDLNNILSGTKLRLFGLGFGSEDYCNESGMENSLEYLFYPRFIIANAAKALNILSVDIACMEINNMERFEEELKTASKLGYAAKFLIHPKQLEVLKQGLLSDEKEYEFAKKVLIQYEKLGKPPVFVYEGRAIEPPHIKKYENILNRK